MKQSQVFGSKSHGDSPDKSEREKHSPVRSPYSRERESRKRKERKPSKSVKNQIKKKAGSPFFLPKKRWPTSLANAGGCITFMRRFKRMNKDMAPNDLLKKATRIWRRLHRSQRKPLENPL
nr:protamine-like protein 99C [Drosophila suzukii]